jgi:hypothetical protein
MSDWEHYNDAWIPTVPNPLHSAARPYNLEIILGSWERLEGINSLFSPGYLALSRRMREAPNTERDAREYWR